MPYVITTTWFPLNKVNDVAKKYVEKISEYMKEARVFGKMVVNNAVKAVDGGIDTIGIWESKEGKLEEFLSFQKKFMINFYEFEGFKFDITVRNKVTEALEWIGMKMPE